MLVPALETGLCQGLNDAYVYPSPGLLPGASFTLVSVIVLFMISIWFYLPQGWIGFKPKEAADMRRLINYHQFMVGLLRNVFEGEFDSSPVSNDFTVFQFHVQLSYFCNP